AVKNQGKDKAEPSDDLGKTSSGSGLGQDPMAGSVKFYDRVDIAAPVGTPIAPPLDGTATFSGKASGYGNTNPSFIVDDPSMGKKHGLIEKKLPRPHRRRT